MPDNPESVATIYARYQQTATGQMRTMQAARNMEILHTLDRPLRILDAAGGNGLNSEWLLRRGHEVTVMDADPEMLDHARRRYEQSDPRGRCTFVRATIDDTSDVFSSDHCFDLVVAHHILEYLQDPRLAFNTFHEVTTPNGELSLVTLNPVSEVIRAILFQRDGVLARARLTNLTYDAMWFGDARLYPFDQIVEWGAQTGWSLRDFRSIRVLADYITEDEYSGSKREEMLALEANLAGREPYRRIGRYLQFCFEKRRRADE